MSEQSRTQDTSESGRTESDTEATGAHASSSGETGAHASGSAQGASAESSEGSGAHASNAEGAHASGSEGAAAEGSEDSGAHAADSDDAAQAGKDDAAQAGKDDAAQAGKDDAAQAGKEEAAPARRSPTHPRPQQSGGDDRAAQTSQQATLERESEGTDEAPRGREARTPVNVGELVWKIAGVLASVVRLIAVVVAIVIVVTIVLRIIGVNPFNQVAQVLGGVADTAVFAFRDLFLLPDPSLALIVNYGLAAIVWIVVGEFLARVIRFVAARVA